MSGQSSIAISRTAIACAFAALACGVLACKSDERAAGSAKPANAGSAATAPAPAPAPAPAIDRDALLAGQMPPGPEADLVNAQCRICHSADYLTQQRLGEAAWKKTIEKMRKFGATLSDQDVAALVAYATRHWNPDLPGRTWSPGPPPPGALPIASAAAPPQPGAK